MKRCYLDDEGQLVYYYYSVMCHGPMHLIYHSLLSNNDCTCETIVTWLVRDSVPEHIHTGRWLIFHRLQSLYSGA